GNRNKVSSDDLSSSKCKRSNDTDEYDDLFETEDFDFSVETKDDFAEDIKEKEVRSLNNISKHQKKYKNCKKKGKVHMTRSSNYKESHGFDVDNKEDK
ncbi:8995_t:CDS:1, partial [Gigaspora margarita]